MEWTTDTPKESGFYWHRALKRMPGTRIAYTKTQLKGENPYFDPKIVKVKIDHSDPEWPSETYSSYNYEMDFDFKDGDLWWGPIPTPAVEERS